MLGILMDKVALVIAISCRQRRQLRNILRNGLHAAQFVQGDVVQDDCRMRDWRTVFYPPLQRALVNERYHEFIFRLSWTKSTPVNDLDRRGTAPRFLARTKQRAMTRLKGLFQESTSRGAQGLRPKSDLRSKSGLRPTDRPTDRSSECKVSAGRVLDGAWGWIYAFRFV